MTSASPALDSTAATRPTPPHRPSHRTLLALLLGCCVLSTPALAKKPTKPAAKNRPSVVAQAASPKLPVSAAAEELMTIPYAGREDVMQLADDLAERRSLDPAWVRAAIGQARMLPSVQRLMLPAAKGTSKNWPLYRSRFIDNTRIQAGLAFWRANRAALERAEQEFGVPAQIIVGIIGVETIYGQNMGSFRVIDALSTLAFDFPSAHPRATERQEFFKNELEQFLSLCNRSGTDPTEPRGSYAGAMGMPQFMPSSIVNFAIDYDGDGRVDLAHSPVDVIGSVANYFHAYNWQTGMPTHYPVKFDTTRLNKDALLAPDILPTFSAANFSALGAVLDGPPEQYTGPLALVELQQGEAAPTYVAGTENFYAITRYNWSSYYAMAVIELGREVAAAQAAASR